MRVIGICALCITFLLGACTLPGPMRGQRLVPDKVVHEDLIQQISRKLQWFAPEKKWHHNCLFLKPLQRLNYDEQRLALANADLLFRAHYEEKRNAYRSAARLYRQAADQGIALAHYQLGELLWAGRGAERNPKSAFALVEQSARLDCAIAEHRLGELLSRGHGIRPNLTLAWAWLEQAKNQGYEGSATYQRKMESVMSQAQIELAHEEAKALRGQINLFNKGGLGQTLVECKVPHRPQTIIVRMRACHAMSGTHVGPPIKYDQQHQQQ